MFLDNLIRFVPLLSFLCFGLCWDAGGEGGAAGGNAGGDAGGAAGGNAGGDAGGKAGAVDKKYTDADLNRLLAEDRRRNQGTATKTQAQLQALLDATDENALPEGSAIRTRIEELNLSLKTKDEQAAEVAKKSEKQLKLAQDLATANEAKYKGLKIGRALLDAALPLAVNGATADIIAERLQKFAALDDKENVVCEMEVKGEDGVEKKKLTPEDAVKYMESQVDLYGSLFKSGVGSGVGGKNEPEKNGKGEVDFSKLSFDQLKELAKKDPMKIGLRPASV